MKSSGLLLGLFVACLCLTVFAAKEPKKKRGRCKCMQRFLKDVDKMIERKMQKLEEKYFLSAISDKDNSSSISKQNRRWLKLNEDVHFTKEALQTMSHNLQFVTEQVNSQNQDTESLNEHFNQLNGYVANLTGVVDRLERMMMARGSLEMTTSSTSPHESPSPEPSYPRHCHEVYLQGGLKFEGDYQILIKPDGAPAPFKAVCRVFNNWGWTVIQRRQDGSVDFYRSWADYKVGFGDKHKEFWLGNDNLHYLTTQGDTMLLIEMQDWDGKKYVANYDHFSIDNETKLYRLHVSGYHGNAGDSLTSHWENHDGMAFSTKDKDNDGRYYDSCAHHYHGAWWFKNCFDSHLNGKYYTKGFHRNYFQRDGIQWNSIHQYSSLKQVEMMLKPAEQPKPTAKISNDV
ncbi:fibrinogen-like protein A isoform X1 [Haliotis cracherodii]|uniref:fibrinogen-like protein A isoform X1 n=1 Tax=Haliotis cracherodii TaxID=6455 RepID=UPI0039E86CE7